jgi:hypothetical protein
LAQTKDWEEFGFEGGKHNGEGYPDIWKGKNRLEKKSSIAFSEIKAG